MFLVVASILVIGGFIWFQAHRIGKLQEQNEFLRDLADRAMVHALHMEAKYNIAKEDVDYLLSERNKAS